MSSVQDDNEGPSPRRSSERPAGDSERIVDQPLHAVGSRAVSGGLIFAVAQGAKFVFNLAGAMILARLLAPEDFGLVAMVTALMVFLAFFKDAGLSTATVQKEGVTHQQVSNLFWINVALGIGTTGVGVAIAPLIAWFYEEPRLTSIMILASLTFLLTGSAVQHHALLMRQMRFKAIAAIDVASPLVGIAVACGLAASQFGYWSIVAMHLSTPFVALAMTWWLSAWRPSRPRRRSGMRSMLHFGAHLTASGIIGRLATGSDEILIGRFHGAEALGYYTRAAALIFRPLEQLLSPAGAVLIPVLSRLRADPARYKTAFLHIHGALAIACFLLTAPLCALATPIVTIVLGPGWDATAPLFAGLALAAIYLPMNFSASWLFTSQGRGRDWLRATGLLSAVTLAAYFVGLPFGAIGIVLAFSLSGVLIRLPIMYYLAGREGPVTTLDLWNSFATALPCWFGAYGGAAVMLAQFGDVAPFMQILVSFPAGLLLGGIVVLCLHGSRRTTLYALGMLKTSVLFKRERPTW